MFGKKVFAAMLATVLGASLFGASAAKAEIDLDLIDMGAVTYATETLADSVTGFADYSVVMAPSGGDLLDVTAEDRAGWALWHFCDCPVLPLVAWCLVTPSREGTS